MDSQQLLEGLKGDDRERADALEALLSDLLVLAGLSPRASDGLVILREDVTVRSYWAVGTLYLIEDQSAHPVRIELVLGGDHAIASGSVKIGIAEVRGGMLPL